MNRYSIDEIVQLRVKIIVLRVYKGYGTIQ